MSVYWFLAVVIWFWYGIFGLNNRETNLIECDDMAHSLRIVYRIRNESMKTFKTYNSNNNENNTHTEAMIIWLTAAVIVVVFDAKHILD